MKKIIGVSGAVILMLGTVFAFAQSKATKTIAVKTTNDAMVSVAPFCQYSMQFLAATVIKESNKAGAGGVAIQQVFGKDGKPLPCQE